MRSIHLYILKHRLASIFKQAELYMEQGVEPGNQCYQDLAEKANKLIGKFNNRTDIPVPTSDFPAYDQLCEIAFPISLNMLFGPKQSKYINGLFIYVLGIASIGITGALVNISYHGWLRLFQWMGM